MLHAAVRALKEMHQHGQHVGVPELHPAVAANAATVVVVVAVVVVQNVDELVEEADHVLRAALEGALQRRLAAVQRKGPQTLLDRRRDLRRLG